MAGKKISELPALGSTYAGTDLFEISVDGGGGSYSSKSITGANISSSAAASVQTIYNTSASLLAARTVTMGAYDLNFASTTGGQQVTFGKNVRVDGQGFTELHTGITDMTFSWDDGNVQSSTMGASTPTFIPTNPEAGATYILTLAQTGTVTVNWNSLVKWPAGTAPTLTGSGKTDIITLICYNDSGAGLYYGSATLDFNP